MSSIFTLLVATLARRGGVRAMGQPSLPYSMVALRARFANDDETLWPGETVDVTLTLATLTNVVVVPSSSVQAGLAGPYLLVVRPDLTVERRPVTMGNQFGKETIIASGIEAGERLIVSGQKDIAPGKQIKIQADNGHFLARTQ